MPDQLLPQPPPDAPAPPAGEHAVRSRRKMGWIIWTGIVSMFAVVFFTIKPIIMRSYRNAERTSAISNLRQIGLALFEFESDYGRLPDNITSGMVKRKSGTMLTLSDRTSNEVFVQIIAAGLAEERVFDAHSKSARTPDGVCNSDATALAHGETGFAYVSGLSSKDNTAFPIVFGPVIPGTSQPDRAVFNGWAMVLKLDNSVTSFPISRGGQIRCSGGDLLDPANPLWGGKVPDVRWPK